jgi:hypothetical protein
MTADWMLPIAIVCSILATGISSWNIYQHLQRFTRPELQKSVIRILFIVPLYAIIGVLSLSLPDVSLYLDTFRDVYEAYVIYLFLNLMISLAGGPSMCASNLKHKRTMPHPWPCCCLNRVQLGAEFLRVCKAGTLQFVVAKPVMALFSFVFLKFDLYYSWQYQLVLQIVYNVTYTVALIALYYFYLAVRDQITAYSPFKKFAAVKVVVFLTYWQSFIVMSFPTNTPEKLVRLDDFVLCVEMVLFALLHLYAFSPAEFHKYGPSQDMNMVALTAGLGVGDSSSDHSSSHNSRNQSPEGGLSTKADMAKNMITVINLRDVATDVHELITNKKKPIEEYRGVHLLQPHEDEEDEQEDDGDLTEDEGYPLDSSIDIELNNRIITESLQER